MATATHSELATRAAIGQLEAVLNEAFAGSPHEWSYFTDAGPAGGLVATLDTISAQDASLPIGGTSIAAHAGHIAFGLAVSRDWIGGDRSPRDWTSSWQAGSVDDQGWNALRAKLRRLHGELRTALVEHAAADDMAFGASVGAIAHVAYHLGAIRQKIAVHEGK